LDTVEKIAPAKQARQRALFPTVTTAQQPGSIVKSVRDIMRTDKGLNGDLDRLPMLAWILFLKFLYQKQLLERSS
jgi:type I restriction enzyme M protein